jgi:hypothetical protein
MCGYSTKYGSGMMISSSASSIASAAVIRPPDVPVVTNAAVAFFSPGSSAQSQPTSNARCDLMRSSSGG